MSIFPATHSTTTSDYRRRRHRSRIAVLLSSLAVIVIVVSFAASILDRGPFALDNGKAVPQSRVLVAWKDQHYDTVLALTGDSLSVLPLDSFHLVFKGFASFYKAMQQPEGDERTDLLDSCVMSLRKALASGKKIAIKPQVEYVLGKAYYHKGVAFQDLSVTFLEASLVDGYKAGDSHEYLGVLLASLGKKNEALIHFEKAMESGKSDLLLLSAAKTYQDSGDSAKAESLLKEIVVSGTDVTAREKAALLLASLGIERKEYASAETTLLTLLEKNPEMADAWFALGTLYQERGDPVKARATWRKAVAADPMHLGARQKLREKL